MWAVPLAIATALLLAGPSASAAQADAVSAGGALPLAPAETEAFPAELLRPRGVPGIEVAHVLVPEDAALAGRVRVVYWPGGEARARRTIEVLERVPTPIGLPSGLPTRAVIFLAPDRPTWNALTGGGAPDWGAGVAIPSLGRAVVPLFEAPGGGPAARDRTILHEWAHLGLHEHLEGLQIPRWFDEGYADLASGGWSTEDAWRLRLALAGGDVALDSLTLGWPGDRVGAELAYLLSGSAVEFLFRGSGPAGVELFLDRWREAGSFDTAFRGTFGTTPAGFERLWRRHVERTYGWVLVASRTAVFWMLAGVAILVLLRIRRRRDLERLARLRATEPPARPAYWEEPQPVDRATPPG